MHWNARGIVALSCLAFVGCSGDSGEPALPGVGGASAGVSATAVGGNSGSLGGNATRSGGAPGSSGAPALLGGSGGALVGLGGAATNTGGQNGAASSANGGNSVGGNASTTGGASLGGAASGGTASGGAAAGGAANGGKSGGAAVGGGAVAGGAAGKAGAATGGNPSTGGATAKGGTTATGGNGGGGTTKLTVWIAGDSTVQTCSSACPCGWGSPAAFGSYFNTNVTINNQAMSGRSVQTWMYEPNVGSTMGSNGECTVTETNSTRWSTVANGMKAGDYFFIQFGINDGSSTCPRHVGSARYKTLLTRLAQTAIDKGAHPILVTPTGAIKCSGSVAVATRGFITETKAVGTALGIPVVDLHALSTALYNSLEFCPLPAGNSDISASTGGPVGAFFCSDHTHFDASGAKQIAGAVAKALKDQGIPLSAYLL